MIFDKKHIIFIFINLISFNFFSQEKIKNNFRSPIGIPIHLSGNFGELRSNHFHSGLDIKTNGAINYRIYSIEKGWVSRINISHWGYGKAIYVDHPNGFTSVYAHLNHFPLKIEKYLREFQYKSLSESVNYYLDSNLIKVEKGEIIAFSGNSGGSLGPHLHFEIRDTKTEHPLNPQLFGFDINDDIPPVINELKLYHFKNNLYNHICDDQGYRLTKSANNYYLKNDSVISIQGKFGIGVSTVDYYNNSNNKCGIYKAELFLDEQLYFELKIDELDFETTKQINVYKDYKAYQNNMESIHKLFIHPLNNLSFYNINLGDGTLEIKDDSLHKITVKVSDINNNSSFLNFYVKSTSKTNRSKDTILKEFNNKIVNKDSSCIILLDSNTLYNRQEINLKYKNILQIGSKDIPVNKSFAVYLKLKHPVDDYSNKLFLAHFDDKGKIKNRKGKINNGWLETKVNHFGDFQLMMDTVPPLIKPIYQPEEIKTNDVLKFKLTDDLSGVDSYQVSFDDKWVLANYNYKTAQLKIPIDRYTKLENKKYNCLIIAKDERNNEVKYSFKIFVHN
tara:strand:- start:28809 stop:30494 length:1686 start_codon:yes stop_codon:yes gene_type:complete